MRGITEERLKEVFSKLYWSTNDDKELFTALLSECTELNAWQPRRIVLEEVEAGHEKVEFFHDRRYWKIVEDGK